MIGKYVQGRVYVFIDAANLESSLKELGWFMDYRKLYEYFKNNTNLGGIRYYCVRFDVENQDKFFTVLKHIGFELITKKLKTIRRGGGRKANFDVEIALDAYSFLSKYDSLVLFSGDSDFDYLVKLLREKGKRVVVVSTRYHISRELIERCNKYIDLRKLRDVFERC